MKKTTKKLLGARIKELRNSRRLSQAQLAEKIDIDYKHLSRIEVGGSYPSLDTLEKISIALDVELKELFEYAQDQDSKQIKMTINKLVSGAGDKELRTIAKIIRAIVR